jgi:hypothetical protein
VFLLLLLLPLLLLLLSLVLHLPQYLLPLLDLLYRFWRELIFLLLSLWWSSN